MHPFFIYNVVIMLDSVRDFLSGPRLFIVIACCALPFVFLGTSSLQSGFTSSYGKINGEEVSQEDVQIAANITVQKFTEIFGEDFDLNSLDQSFQAEQIKQELITQKILLAQARKLGLINKRSKDETKKDIIRNQAFYSDGAFDEGLYEIQVKSQGFTKESYLEKMSEFNASDIFTNSLLSRSYSTPHEAKELTKILEQTIDFNFIKVSFEALKSSISIEKSFIEDYYNNNEALFYSDETRSIKYFELSKDDFINKVSIPDGYLETEYSSYIKNSQNNNQKRIAHIMVEKSNNDALSIINTAKQKLNEGASFENIVKEYSDDIATVNTGGDLEYYSPDLFPEEFGAAIEKLQLNDISDVVELEDSYHILKLTEFVETEVLSFEEKKEEILSSIIESESIALLKDEFNNIDNSFNFRDLAEKYNKEIISENKLSKSNYDFINDDRVLDFIFSPETNSGSKNVFDFEESITFILVDEIIQPYLKELASVSVDIESTLRDAQASNDIEKINRVASKENLKHVVCTEKDFVKLIEFEEELEVDISAITIKHQLSEEIKQDILARLV